MIRSASSVGGSRWGPLEAELAAVLAREASHVVARHSAEQIAKTQLTGKA